MTSFHLTFSGVDFCLEPKPGSGVSFQHETEEEITIELINFSGNLKVLNAAALASVVSNKSNHTHTPSDSSTTARVEESDSPLPVNRVSVSPQQQQPPPQQKTICFPSKKSKKTNKKSEAKKKRAKSPPVSPVGEEPEVEPTAKKSRTMEDTVQLTQPEIEEQPTPTQEEHTGQDDEPLVEAMDTSPMEEESAVDTSQPCPRWGHSMTLIDDQRALVYGGQTIQNGSPTTLKDIYVYNLAENTWTKPINCEGFQRQWHTATYVPERQLLISFGGEAPNEKKTRMEVTDQVMVLDTEIMLWYPPGVSGDIPSGRSGHTATMLSNNNEMVIFGGVKGSRFQRDVAVLNTSRWIWERPAIHGDPPRPRSYHSATAIPKDNGKSWLVIFGGNDQRTCFNSVHCLEQTKDKAWTWINPIVFGDPPAPRTGHCATLLEDQKTILIYGGWDPNENDDSDEDTVYNDSFYLDTSTWTWSPGPTSTGYSRTGHAAARCGSEVVAFGGRLVSGAFTDTFVKFDTTNNTH